MKNVWIAAAILFLAPVSAICGGNPPAPAKMIHMIVRMSGTDIPADSFGAKPKTMWRASNAYCRIDEEPDPSEGIHLRSIMNEPDAWLVDLVSKTAKHMVDPGPTFNCRMPIFAFDENMMKSTIGGLEFGHELEFFQKNGAKQVDGPPADFKVVYYELTIDDMVLRMAVHADTNAPAIIGMVQGKKIIDVQYLLWDDQGPFNSSLFAAPTGVTVEEVK
ncbi:MAG: hypothetical protein WA871_02230 [Candidatus Acidiferrales bacterium]